MLATENGIIKGAAMKMKIFSLVAACIFLCVGCEKNEEIIGIKETKDYKLEILVNLRDTARQRSGDIVVVKRSPAKWGVKEQSHFLITYLSDTDLYNNTIDIKSNPYKIYHKGPSGHRKIINLSKYRIDIPGSFGEPKPTGLRKPNGKEYLLLEDCIFDSSSRIIDE